MEYEFDDDPARIQADVVWAWLSSRAYWGRWRARADFEAQLASAWRVVGVYRGDTGEQVGFARAVSDGVALAYLADVYIAEEHQGAGLGKRLIARMIEDAPGHAFRWILFTKDGHGLYERYGFAPADGTTMVRPAVDGRR